MSKILISLIGHQTLPILLAIKQIRPDKVILLYSNRLDMQRRKSNLLSLLPTDVGWIDLPPVDPWKIDSVARRLLEYIENEEIEGAEFICDVTGGTKAMSIGLAHFAEQYGHKVLYLESDNGESVLQSYTLSAKKPYRIESEIQITETVTIDEFLQVYLGSFNTQPHLSKNPDEKGAIFEADVRKGFEETKLLNEIKYAIKPNHAEEIDIILRKGNRFAIVECKQGGEARKAYGILQLSNLGSERYLGTYTRKILAVTANYRRESSHNAKMADEHGVYLLELPNWQPGAAWSQAELQEFVEAVETVFS